MAHIPVLLHEVITGLAPEAGETYLDATLGSGGHALAIGEILGPSGRIIGLDQDSNSLAKAEEVLKQFSGQADLALSNFRDLDKVLTELKVHKVNRILFDLGVHSDQFGPSGRGFSFMYDEPLLMTMGELREDKLTAKDIVNFWTAADLENVLVGYGEEQFAERIAEQIVKARRDTPIATTFDLVRVIESAVPAWYRHRKLHPATKTFQALRIAVNDELEALKEGLEKAVNVLAPGGRLAVISFHSLEARIVKDYFKSLDQAKAVKLVTKHAVQAKWSETSKNRRARSAQLRIIEKI